MFFGQKVYPIRVVRTKQVRNVWRGKKTILVAQEGSSQELQSTCHKSILTPETGTSTLKPLHRPIVLPCMSFSRERVRCFSAGECSTSSGMGGESIVEYRQRNIFGGAPKERRRCRAEKRSSIRVLWSVRFFFSHLRFQVFSGQNLTEAEKKRTLQHPFGRPFPRTTPSPLLP